MFNHIFDARIFDIKPLVCILAIVMTVALIAGCGNDADKGSRDTGSAKMTINMPDGFPNVSLKCVGKSGLYVTNNTTNGSGSPAVVLNDPQCGGSEPNSTSTTTP